MRRRHVANAVVALLWTALFAGAGWIWLCSCIYRPVIEIFPNVRTGPQPRMATTEPDEPSNLDEVKGLLHVRQMECDVIGR